MITADERAYLKEKASSGKLQDMICLSLTVAKLLETETAEHVNEVLASIQNESQA